MILRSLVFSGSLIPLMAWAGVSQNYGLDQSALSNGGKLGVSQNYTADLSIVVGGASSSTNYTNRTGYAGQLADVVAMKVVVTTGTLTISERGTRQFVAVITYDDESLAAPASERMTWSVVGGPLSMSAGGLATAGTVYQDTGAGVRAAYLTFSDTVGITVVNIGVDDFGSYAADGLPDTWQVQYFGESGIHPAAGADADYDGLTNLQEYAFGMNPSQSYGGMLRWSGASLLERGVPTPFASGTAGSFTFRAVFARRKNYVAAGLSYTVEFSGDLSTWKASTSSPSVLADDGEIQAVSVPYPFFVNGKKATYFRVKVQSN